MAFNKELLDITRELRRLTNNVESVNDLVFYGGDEPITRAKTCLLKISKELQNLALSVGAIEP